MRRALAVGALAVVACSNNKSPPGSGSGNAAAKAPAAPERPLALEWTESEIMVEFKVTGGTEKGDAYGSEKGIVIGLDEFAADTKYQVGDKKGAVRGGGRTMVEVDGLDFLGAVLYDKIEHVDTGLSLELSLPDGRHGTAKLPPLSFKYHLKDIFNRIEHGPVTFGKEPVDPKPSDSMFFLEGGVIGEIVGASKSLQEIDYIVTDMVLDAEKGRKTCSGYTGPTPSFTLVLKDTEVTIWNRRTGDVVEKKVFAPDSECPMMVMTKAGQTEADSYPPTQKIQAWLKSKIKR